MSNRVEPEIPSITLDQDQVKSSRHSHSTQKNTRPGTENQAKPSKINSFFSVVIALALAASSWYFYQENIKLQAVIAQSEQRIQSLENQLSATGEEIGESTIALKTKLEAVSETANKLWDEMDKLWASAWRRNQSEIKELRSANKKLQTTSNNHSQQITNTSNAITNINEKLTSSELNINALADQITAANNVQSEISALRDKINNLEEKSSSRDSQQIEVATSVNQLEMSVTLLVERLEQLEKAATPPSIPTPNTIQ